jgi:hypothetical protein
MIWLIADYKFIPEIEEKALVNAKMLFKKPVLTVDDNRIVCDFNTDDYDEALTEYNQHVYKDERIKTAEEVCRDLNKHEGDVLDNNFLVKIARCMGTYGATYINDDNAKIIADVINTYDLHHGNETMTITVFLVKNTHGKGILLETTQGIFLRAKPCEEEIALLAEKRC